MPKALLSLWKGFMWQCARPEATGLLEWMWRADGKAIMWPAGIRTELQILWLQLTTQSADVPIIKVTLLLTQRSKTWTNPSVLLFNPYKKEKTKGAWNLTILNCAGWVALAPTAGATGKPPAMHSGWWLIHTCFSSTNNKKKYIRRNCSLIERERRIEDACVLCIIMTKLELSCVNDAVELQEGELRGEKVTAI